MVYFFVTGMDYVRDGEIKRRSLVFLKAHCPCLLPCLTYSVSHNFIYPSKELCSKIALGEVGVSLPWKCKVETERLVGS